VFLMRYGILIFMAIENLAPRNNRSGPEMEFWMVSEPSNKRCDAGFASNSNILLAGALITMRAAVVFGKSVGRISARISLISVKWKLLAFHTR